MSEHGIFMCVFGAIIVMIALIARACGYKDLPSDSQFGLNKTTRRELETYTDDKSRNDMTQTIEAMNANRNK